MIDHRTSARDFGHLEPISRLPDWHLEDKAHDLRGQTLHNRNGRPLGRIAEMLVDVKQQRVAALRLEDGFVVDVDDVDMRDGQPMLMTAGAPAPPPPGGRGGDSHALDAGDVRITSRSEHQPAEQARSVSDTRVRVERVAVDRVEGSPPERRHADGVTIIPEYEEILVVRYRVTGEVHVIEETRAETRPREPLRRTVVGVDRQPPLNRGR